MFDPCRGEMLTLTVFANNLWLINHYKWVKLQNFLNFWAKINILVLVLATFIQIWVLTPVQPRISQIAQVYQNGICRILNLDTFILHFQ